MANKNSNQQKKALVEPEDLAVQVEDIVVEMDAIIDENEALKGEVEDIVVEMDAIIDENEALKDTIEEQTAAVDGNLDKKTLVEIVEANAAANPDKLPCYVTGDGNCFAQNAYTYALKHCKAKEGLALYHCVKGKKGWVVK